MVLKGIWKHKCPCMESASMSRDIPCPKHFFSFLFWLCCLLFYTWFTLLAKLARLKQAKEEAEKEIAEYRAQVELEFQKKLAAVCMYFRRVFTGMSTWYTKPVLVDYVFMLLFWSFRNDTNINYLISVIVFLSPFYSTKQFPEFSVACIP